MARHERSLSVDVFPADGRHLADAGGRFRQGLHVIVERDKVTAWIPEGGRTASGPPKFIGLIDGKPQQLRVTGVIREARVDQFTALLWGLLTVLALGSAVGGGLAANGRRGELLFVLIFAAFAFFFAVLAVTGQRGRATTFSTKSARLESSLKSWAGTRP